MVIVRIEDRFSGDPNTYGVVATAVDNGDGTITVTFTFSALPADATGTAIGWSTDGGITWTSSTGGVSSPRSITIPAAVYSYQFVVQRPGGNEIFNLDELDGEWTALEAAGDPLHLIVNNNGQSKIDNSVFGLQCVFKFNSTVNENLNKLLRGTYSDRRYYMTVAIEEEDRFVFKGFISLADTQEAFMPVPNVVMLTATDGLGVLKNKSLLDFDGNNPTNENLIIKYIAWCLKQTGLNENINVVMNIREEDAGGILADPTAHMYNTQFLDAKTFEKEIGESEDCYSVLEKVLKRCRLGQRHGEWWIKNVDEFDTQPDYVAVFDSMGEFVEMGGGAVYEKEIGGGLDMWWSQESQVVSFSSPSKFAKETYKYQHPKEVPCNSDFSRGALTDTITADDKRYNTECWDKLWSNTSSDDPATGIYTRKIFESGVEKERYLVIEGNSQFRFAMSEAIPMNARDKFRLDIQRSLSTDVTGSGFYRDNHVQVRLYADDGTFWTHQSKTSASNERKWVQCDATFRTFQNFFSIEGDASDDLREIATLYDNECAPLPVGGVIKILLYRSSLFGSTRNTHFSCRFEYLALINGAYELFTGQQHKVIGQYDDIQMVEDEVFINDSPSKIFKGALQKWNGTDYVLSGRFWNAAVNPAGPPDESYYHQFGYIQTFNTWNQCRLLNRILTGSVQGTESGSTDLLNKSDLPTIFHTYYLRDVNEHTNNKMFLSLSYDMDLRLCEWRPVLREVFDMAQGKAYNDSYDFKYLTR
jgi:hypothetical protein